MSDIIAFSHKYNLQFIKIEDIQNISLFIIACSSFLSCLYLSILFYFLKEYFEREHTLESKNTSI